MNTTKKTAAGFVALIAALTLALTGCASAGDSAVEKITMADQITLTDAWIKEPSEAMPTMTALFGLLENSGENEVVLVGGSSDIAGMVQIHEVTAEGQMQEIAGGLKIAAGKTSILEPGANHVMLMELSKALAVGDEVTVTLKFKDGSTLKVTAPVKSAAGGDESYDEGSEHSEMNMG